MSDDGSNMVLAILREARTLLARPNNDFVWSSWEDADAALEEIDTRIHQLELGDWPRRLDLKVLFAPTGPMQEVSLSSGWADEFLTLAERFDAVVSSIPPSQFSAR